MTGMNKERRNQRNNIELIWFDTLFRFYLYRTSSSRVRRETSMNNGRVCDGLNLWDYVSRFCVFQTAMAQFTDADENLRQIQVWHQRTCVAWVMCRFCLQRIFCLQNKKYSIIVKSYITDLQMHSSNSTKRNCW